MQCNARTPRPRTSLGLTVVLRHITESHLTERLFTERLFTEWLFTERQFTDNPRHRCVNSQKYSYGWYPAGLAAYKTIFHLQRIWIVKDSAPILRFFAVVYVYVCNQESIKFMDSWCDSRIQVLRSRSYHRYYHGIKKVQVPSFFMDFGDQWLEISVLKFSAFWPRRFGHTPFWELKIESCLGVWVRKSEGARLRADVAFKKNSLGQFILLRLSNLYLNFECCTVCLMYLWRIWSIHDFMYVLCIVVGIFFRFKLKMAARLSEQPWPLKFWLPSRLLLGIIIV